LKLKARMKLGVLIASGFLAVGVSQLFAATIPVTSTNDSGPGSLRAALASAADGDTIDASGISGTITLTSGELVVSNGVSITGPGPDQLAINGNHASRVLSIGPGVTVTVSSLTITNGSTAAPGGGIYNGSATLTVSNCILSGNASTNWGGGGIYNDGFGFNNRGARLTVVNCTFSSNVGKSVAGGIFNDGRNGGIATLEISGSTFSGNAASLYGGGIYSSGSAAGSATLTLRFCTFDGNVASNAGGGIYNDRGTLEIANSTLSGNSTLVNGSGGGGIYNLHGTLTVSNCTLSENVAAEGGGIENNGFGFRAKLTIVNSTLSGNSANVGGGILIYGSDGGSIMTIGNSILNSNSAVGPFASGGSILILNGTVTSLGYNLCSDDGGGVLTATGDQINTDPMLGQLQDNGGPTFTHALLCGSPAIDKGKNFAGDTTDQRGFPRPFDDPGIANATGGDGTDIGAFEVQIADTVPKITGVSVDKPILWPPNHKLVDVTVSYDVTDNCDPSPSCRLSVASSQPINDKGDGNTSPDWVIVDAHHVRLRAERTGNSKRIYTITITCTDQSGNSSTQTVRVKVPKDQKK
jgi:hypothetical protein